MTDKSDHRVGHLNTILAQGGGNVNDPIFKSSNARALPREGAGGGGGGKMKFRVDRRIKTGKGLVPKERICGPTSSTKFELLLVFCFAVVAFVLFLFLSRSLCLSSRHHATLPELLKICHKLQYREKSSAKQIKN